MASSNGKVADSNDRVVLTPERSSPKKTGRVRWIVGLLVRLCIWYFLLTPFFRCPSQVSELTESSPRICKPYLAAKSYVEPHVAPYYHAHAAPYVDAARPYVHVLNEKVYTPASNIAKQGYEAYGAPALDRAQAYGQQQWDANVVPHIQTAKGKASDWYELHVAPHVEYATITVSPYYHKVHGAYWTTLNGYILPFAAKYQPFIGKTYTSGQEILTTQVMPHAQSAWSSTLSFINYSFWPKVSSLYSENVEPQLVKIGQRLASYREGNRLRSVADEVESSAGYSTTSSSTSVEASTTVAPISSSVSETTTPSLSPTELAAQLRKKIVSDLTTWKEKFASASEKGVASLEGRVVEIVDTYLAGGAQSDGDKLVAALESTVEDQTTAIKHRISALTESLPFTDAPEEEEAAIEELLKEIRNSAVSIRDRAHVIREWYVSFEEGLIHQVSAAVNSTLAVLDNIRELGLQEIGMRWAWMDGVTYKDWEDYHALKEEFEDWKGKFREIGLQHARIEYAKDTADEALSRGMDIAEAAANELARLKEVGRWKIAAREVSEDFDTRSEPPPPLPKPASAEEDTPIVQDEDQEEAEEKIADVNDTADDTNAEADGESPNLGSFEKPTKGQDAGSDGESSSDDKSEPEIVSEEESINDGYQGNARTPESNEEADVEYNKGFFGAAASVIPEEAADSGYDTDNLDQDEIVEAEATKLSEAVSQSVKVEDHNTAPAASEDSQSIEDLLSHILGDTNPDFAEKVMQRLNAMNQNPKMNQDSASSPGGKVDGDVEAPEQPQAADASEDQPTRNDL